MNPPSGSASYPAIRQSTVGLMHDLDLMPATLELVETIQKARDQQEINRKVAGFRARIQQCRELLSKTSGLEVSADQQQQQLEKLNAQLKTKRELLEKFVHLKVLTAPLVKKEP